jgi:hypothetical protein
VRRIDHVAQTFFAHVGVVLRCRKIGMTEEFLHRPEIGSAIEQMGGECVPQRMRMGWRRRASIEETSHVAGAHTAALAIQKHCIGW